ncbi:Na+/H+ antiporter NhaA [Shigella flexneri]
MVSDRGRRIPSSPLFAFRQTPGVSLQGVTLDGLTSILPLAYHRWLPIGSRLGLVRCWSAMAFETGASAQDDLSANYGGGYLCGIGFTMLYLYCQLWPF